MRQTGFAIFFLIFLCLYFLIHLYVYKRTADGLALSSMSRAVLIACMVVFAVANIVSKLISKKVFIYPLNYTGAVWFGFITTALTILFAAHIIIKFYPLYQRGITISALVCIIVVTVISLINGARLPVVKEFDIPVSGLPPQADGFSIVQLSDIHLDNIKSEKWLKQIVDMTNALEPDLIVITGDVVDMPLLRGYDKQLRRLKAKHGVIAVTGNHDYYAGIYLLEELMRKTGIILLKGDAKEIGGAVLVAGIDDDTSNKFAKPARSLTEILKGVISDKPVVFLNHQPTHYKEAEKLGVALQLSGHVHNGQFLPFNIIVRLIKRYPHGLYKRGKMYMYTTAGTGTWDPPMRFMSKSEIVKFSLVFSGNGDVR